MPQFIPLSALHASRSPIYPGSTAYLSEIIYLNKSRTAITQVFAGGSEGEIAIFLRRQGFKPDEIKDMLQGFVIENALDSRKQYRLDPQLIKGTYKRGKPIKALPSKPPTPAPSDTTLPPAALQPTPQPSLINPLLKEPTMVKAKDWPSKVREYRETAKMSQVKLSKAIGSLWNIISSIESGTRKFSADERTQFFKVIGVPEDPSIPIMSEVEALRSVAAQKARAESRKAKEAQAPKTAKKAKKEQKAIKPEPRQKAAAKQSKPKKVAPGSSATRQTHLDVPSLSPIKAAVLADMGSVIGHPDMTDQQASRLHSLFRSLAVTALLGS